MADDRDTNAVGKGLNLLLLAIKATGVEYYSRTLA